MCLFMQANTPQAPEKMVGFGRLVSDYTTFAYLTDVYVLPDHRGHGLANALMKVVDDIVQEWPHLRRMFLLAANPQAEKLYVDVLKMQKMQQNSLLTVYQRTGGGFLKMPEKKTLGEETPKNETPE
jgi:GNAT superfamily N-acetyltransferase